MLMDEADAAEAALIGRCFPNASQVATGLFPRPTEIGIALAGGRVRARHLHLPLMRPPRSPRHRHSEAAPLLHDGQDQSTWSNFAA